MNDTMKLTNQAFDQKEINTQIADSLIAKIEGPIRTATGDIEFDIQSVERLGSGIESHLLAVWGGRREFTKKDQDLAGQKILEAQANLEEANRLIQSAHAALAPVAAKLEKNDKNHQRKK